MTQEMWDIFFLFGEERPKIKKNSRSYRVIKTARLPGLVLSIGGLGIPAGEKSMNPFTAA